MIDELKSRISSEAAEMQKKVRERVLTYISAGLGLVVGLAWNDAIASMIKFLFPVGANAVWAKFVYALALTFFITLAIVMLEKTIKGREEEDKK